MRTYDLDNGEEIAYSLSTIREISGDMSIVIKVNRRNQTVFCDIN